MLIRGALWMACAVFAVQRFVVDGVKRNVELIGIILVLGFFGAIGIAVWLDPNLLWLILG